MPKAPRFVEPSEPRGPRLVLATAPDAAVAERLAHHLVEHRLAACVNQVPGVRSVYRWEGAVQSDDEVLLLIKTDGRRMVALVEALEREHPYDCPEIVELTISGGSEAYLEWMATSLRDDD